MPPRPSRRSTYSEHRLVHAPAAQQLQQLGWQVIWAQNETLGEDGTLGRKSEREVVLERDLRAAIERINPGLPAAAYDEALKTALAPSSQSPLQINATKYALLRNGVPVQYRDPKRGQVVKRNIRLVDFDNPENNHFLAVCEFWVCGEVNQRKRPDLIGFVNGFPLVFIEFKNATIHIEDARTLNYADYCHTIPRLFDWNALVIISNGHDAQYAAFGAPKEHFYRFKRIEETDPEPLPIEPLLPILLSGMLDKKRLLDIIENFTLFDRGHKIIARNHQYLGVNRLIERLQSNDLTVREELAAGRLGVFWHTQGSGKSYSMVFLTEKIHRKISGQYTFVIVTDRTELDDQIAQTYTHCGCANAAQHQANSGADLRKKLQEQNLRYVFTLVQKYNERPRSPYSTRSDIIVISDEAHRTQYGSFALNMRRGLPHAKFLGFTGTPLIDNAEKQLTRDIFGDYVSVYDFQNAVADNATVPLTYENRGEKLKLSDPDLNKRIAENIETMRSDASARGEPWNDDKEQAIYEKLASEYLVLTSSERLERLANDFVEHFHRRWQAVDGGASKCMLVCIDKITCVKMYDLITHKWQEKIAELEKSISAEEKRFTERHLSIPDLLTQRRAQLEWMKATECCVVVSYAQDEVEIFKRGINFRGEPLDIAVHRQKMTSRNLELEFKSPENPFRIAIVCAMWLTGFDVKCLATLYLDKAMSGHTLMQAIARANRVGGGKKSGLIVDYNGVLDGLRRALATFAKGDLPQPTQGEAEQEKAPTQPLITEEQALAEYAQSITLAREILANVGFDLQQLVQAPHDAQRTALLNTAASRLVTSAGDERRFRVTTREIQARWRSLWPNERLDAWQDEADAIRAIERKLQAVRTTADIAAELQALYPFIDQAIAIDNLETKTTKNASIDLSSIDLDKLRHEFSKSQHQNLIILNLQEKIEKCLQAMLAENPTRSDLVEQYENIIEAYNQHKDPAIINATFEKIQQLSLDLQTEESRYLREGLPSQRHLAVFDLITQKEQLSAPEHEEIKLRSQNLMSDLESGLFKITNWRENASACSQVQSHIQTEVFSILSPYNIPSGDIQWRSSEIFTHLYTHSPPSIAAAQPSGQ